MDKLSSQTLKSARLSLRSPAKINLFLRILRKREDNFHEISTLIQAIDLYDNLTFTPSAEDIFTTSDNTLPLDSKNLVIKALNLFRRKTGWVEPLQIHLEKKIPMEAGLGGGSGNAATTLYAMNVLSKLNLSDKTLAEMSSEIGSDIPFFFSTGAAICRGRGEIVESVLLPIKEYSLFKPKVGLSTPSVYKALDLSQTSKEDPDQLLKEFERGCTPYLNDLELAAFTISPALLALKNELYERGATPLMTGSGSVFFSQNNKILSNHPLFIGHYKSISRSHTTWW